MMETKKDKVPFYKNKKTYIVTPIVIAVYVLSLYAPFVKPYTQWPLYLVKCGHAPISANPFAAEFTYQKWGDRHYGVDIFTIYFCSENEAQKNGYRHSS